MMRRRCGIWSVNAEGEVFTQLQFREALDTYNK